MSNARIAELFDEIADLLEFQGANAFRVRAYRKVSRSVKGLAESVESIIADADRNLTDVDGIGKDTAAKIVECVETGKITMRDELLAEIPESVLALLRIPGLGPKKAAVLHRELGIDTLEQLAAACNEHKVRELKGFGAKTEDVILKGMAIAAAADQRIYWSKGDEIAQELLAHLRACKDIRQMEMAGSYRRGKDTVGDLDVLVDSADHAAVMDHFGAFEPIDDVIARGDTKMSVRLDSGLQIDLRVVPTESFGAALQYFTGSKEHNVALRGLAKNRGLKINEYGVFRVDDDKQIAGATEEDVYEAMELPCFPPELRENRGEFELAAAGELPELIALADIRGDLHMHTTASDGRASIADMAAAAKARGLKYIAITDHSKRVSMAHGLDADRLLAQWKEIDELNQSLSGITVLKGIELDILEDGRLDLEDGVLAGADWVVASIHYGQKQSREQITDRITGALANEHVCAIAHPTGRILNRREPYEVDIEAVFAAAVEHGKLLELNSNPARLDLNEIYCAAAKRHGIPIVINTDAHSIEGLDVLRCGIVQARRGGLTKADVANTRTWPQMKKLIGK